MPDESPDEDHEYIPIVMGRPWRVEDYPPERQAQWHEAMALTRAAGEAEPQIYANSIARRCQTCRIRVAVGPRQTALLADMFSKGVRVPVFCPLCAVIEIADTGTGEYGIVALGNQEFGKED